MLSLALLLSGLLGAATPGAADAQRRLLIKGATVVTMDAKHRVIPHGRVLVEGNRIAAVWQGKRRPDGARLQGAERIKRGPDSLLFPGLINLHDHPHFDVLPPVPPPSSHAIPAVGKRGTDPYDQRYEWNGAGGTGPDEFARLIANPQDEIDDLGLAGEEVKYAEVGAMLGGETAIQGAAADPESNRVLVRNVDHGSFGDRIASPQVAPIADLTGAPLADLLAAMRAGDVDAWMVHLAEGVQNADRRPGDSFSSRSEFRTLEAKGLLTDMTVIIHGMALERSDFAAMRAAPTIRDDDVGDGRGAKLVWSPRSNLVLYGHTTDVYKALAEHVLTSLGTDWTPSGSHTLLDELKIADRALRQRQILGDDRGLVQRLAVAGLQGSARARAERSLDRTLVDMVTRNPALSLRWYRHVGSIQTGKRADLLLIHRRRISSRRRVPPSVYRRLIDASERNVRLVTVDGRPLAGGVPLFKHLKPGDFEVVKSSTGTYRKAVDVTEPNVPVPDSGETFAQISRHLRLALEALGGDNPPPGGGPAGASNTYTYLKRRLFGGSLSGLTDATFRNVLVNIFGTDSTGRLNIEAIDPTPVLGPDPLRTAINNALVDPRTGLLEDPAPPFRLYPANLNQIGPNGNPFAGLP